MTPEHGLVYISAAAAPMILLLNVCRLVANK